MKFLCNYTEICNLKLYLLKYANIFRNKLTAASTHYEMLTFLMK